MKTLLDIDEMLLEKAMKLSKAETKKETIHIALEEFIKLRLRQKLMDMAGSGFTDWSLAGLKQSRLKREKSHGRLKKDS
ncbi:MAG: type II toxin-antitoxin system VapB family antitoxin [Nitrospirota bacterium]